jgi:hypothetical protein
MLRIVTTPHLNSHLILFFDDTVSIFKNRIDMDADVDIAQADILADTVPNMGY